jgi:hypothetical protein
MRTVTDQGWMPDLVQEVLLELLAGARRDVEEHHSRD